MFEIRALNPDALAADVAYRRERLQGRRVAHVEPRGRWWRRRNGLAD